MDPFDRVRAWFDSRGWSPFPFQEEVWRAYLAGESGLIHAATGTGKTYAAWLGALMEWMEEGGGVPAGLRVLWITPLRALVADTENALQNALTGLEVPWRLESRTGDTKPAVRARQKKRLPTALVTTPESLALFLAREDSEALFANLRLVVVDEWHELMGSKRGVQTELALARLRRWHPRLRTWGLSATIGNLDTAMAVMMGSAAGPRRIVRGLVPKSIRIDALIPPEMENFPWAGHLGVTMLPQVIEAIEEGETTLVFTNTRSQAEIWFQSILAARPDWAGLLAIHHGSLERKTRDFVEASLREGSLRCVVCTSSLDLGVDFTPVDRVLQIGSPKGVARLLQRAGRSGHRPGVLSRVTCVPTHAFELVEAAAARDAVEAGKVESRFPVERPLDLLSQWLVGMSIPGFAGKEMFDEVRTTNAYAGLTRAEWKWVLEFVTHGGEALRAYPEYARVVKKGGRYGISSKQAARRHMLSIGTIVGDTAMEIRLMTGGRLGTIEESFIARMRAGDTFAFSGRILEFVRVRDMTAWVKKSKAAGGIIPSWQGSRMPLSSELSEAVRARLDEALRGIYEGAEMRAIRPVLDAQAEISIIPARDEFLVERAFSRDGCHLFFFPFEGRLVHEGLAALFAWRISQLQPITFSIACDDYGFELLAPMQAPVEEAFQKGLLNPHNLATDIPASMNAAELAKRQFREIARVAGLTFNGYPGQNKTVRQLQASSGLIFDVFVLYDAGNLLVDQAHREVLEQQLERSRLGRTLERLSRSRLEIRDVERFSPLSFPLVIDRSRNRISSEKLADRIKRMTRR